MTERIRGTRGRDVRRRGRGAGASRPHPVITGCALVFVLIGCTVPDDPSLSPDGRTTVAPPTVAGPSGDVAGQTAEGAPPRDLYRIDLASGDAQPIPSPLEEVRAPERSPDGSQLVYEGRSSTGVPQIFVFEDGRTRQLTQVAGGARDPTWSPDGSLIAFAGSRTPGGTDADTYVMAADGSGVRLVGGTFGEDRRPDWSPDGSQVAFDDYVSIWAVSVEDGETTRLSPGPIELRHGPAAEAAWSPDGRLIAFTRIEPGTINGRIGAAHLWVTRTDGSRERRLGPERFHGICQLDATWSPDGSSVAFIDGSPSRRIGIVDVQTLTLAYLRTSFPVAHLSWGADCLMASTGAHDLPVSADWDLGLVSGCPL